MGNNIKRRVKKMTNNKELNSDNNRTILFKTLTVGFWGGIIWSLFFLFLHTFKMTEVDPFIFWKMIIGEKSWLLKWYAYFILIISYGIISIFVALLYFLLLKKRKHWVFGALFGIILWGIAYFTLPTLFAHYNPFIHRSEEHTSELQSRG